MTVGAVFRMIFLPKNETTLNVNLIRIFVGYL
jgi:hypothetical protein